MFNALPREFAFCKYLTKEINPHSDNVILKGIMKVMFLCTLWMCEVRRYLDPILASLLLKCPCGCSTSFKERVLLYFPPSFPSFLPSSIPVSLPSFSLVKNRTWITNQESRHLYVLSTFMLGFHFHNPEM
jgi:hypothetical protein